VGDAQRFFHALCQAVPIGIRSIVPSATLRQANCYYSSSDAAFEDRYQASAEYERVARGAITLDGGWRVYSSGPGIALGLIVRHFLGLSSEADALSIDPVIPPELDGLRVQTEAPRPRGRSTVPSSRDRMRSHLRRDERRGRAVYHARECASPRRRRRRQQRADAEDVRRATFSPSISASCHGVTVTCTSRDEPRRHPAVASGR
jgi:hypothetical protein